MRPTKEQLAVINSRLPGTEVTAEQLEVLPFMAFDQKRTDRYTVMTKEMMRKIELDMNEGRVAFNSLHRSQSTLPVGRSINARIKGTELHANMYAVHTRPDGTPFEDAKELVDKFNTGAVYACSLGVSVAFYKCNICGNDIRDWSNCEHMLGKTYMKNEQPIICIAAMTGHDIVDGIAMDCGAYELSGVTAGGVANAGILTSTFSKYESGADSIEFKKTAFENMKEIQDQVTFFAHTTEVKNEEESTMKVEEIKALVEEYTKDAVTEKVKVEAAFAALKTDFEALKSENATIKAEFDKATASAAELKSSYEALEAQVVELTKSKDMAETFKAEYISIVEAAATTLGKASADYAAMELEALKELYATYRDEINLLPAGRQSTDELGDPATDYSAIPADCFKA